MAFFNSSYRLRVFDRGFLIAFNLTIVMNRHSLKGCQSIGMLPVEGPIKELFDHFKFLFGLR